MVQMFLAFADGDAGAAALFWNRAWPIVRGFAGRFLAADEADDAAQEALAKILAQAPFFDASRRLLPWMFAITHFEVLSARKRRLRRRESLEDVEISTEGADLAERKIILEAALATVATLRPADQETLMAYLDDERPKTPLFRKQLQRTLNRLRAAWSLAHPDTHEESNK